MDFNKYRDNGDYHWRDYEKGTTYTKHVNKLISWVRKGKTLDIGAGDGLITHKLGAFGIENDYYALEIVKTKKVNVVYGDAYNLDKKVKYDNVLLLDVIEHIEYPEKVINEIKEVLNYDGLLYVVTPPAREDGKLQDKYHYREYTPNELKIQIEKLGFKLVNDIEVVNNFKRMYAVFKKI